MANVQETVRLTPEQLREFKKQLGGRALTQVTGNTTELEAGFKLGVQHAVSLLEEGFTVTRKM